MLVEGRGIGLFYLVDELYVFFFADLRGRSGFLAGVILEVGGIGRFDLVGGRYGFCADPRGLCFFFQACFLRSAEWIPWLLISFWTSRGRLFLLLNLFSTANFCDHFRFWRYSGFDG